MSDTVTMMRDADAWRQLIVDIIRDGSPLFVPKLSREQRCHYCDEWNSQEYEHGESCAWRKAVEALNEGPSWDYATGPAPIA